MHMTRFLSLAIAIFIVCATSSAGTWTSNGPFSKAIRAISISPADSNVIYAGAFGWGVFKSTNAGVTWASMKTGLTNTHVRSIVALSNSEVFCGTNDGVFKSTDGGASWVSVWPTAFSVRGLAYDPGPGSLYAATFGAGLFKSTNHGASWTALTVTDPISAQTLSHQWTVAVFGNDSLYVGGSILDIASGGALFRSVDGGASWLQVQRSIGIRSSVHAIAVSPSNPDVSLIIGTATKGVYKSTNGGTNWTDINGAATVHPLADLSINAVGFSPDFRFAGTDSIGNFFSRALGDTTQGWIAAAGLPGAPAVVNAIAINRQHQNSIILGTEGQGTFASTNAGASWLPRNTGMLGTAGRVVRRLSNGDLLLGTDLGDGIWISTTMAASWTKLDSFPTSNAVTGIELTSNPSVVYAAAYGSGIYKSTDGGHIWHITDSASINHFVRELIVHPSDPNTVYAGTGNGVYKTTNGGTGWFAVNTGIPPSTSIRSMALDPVNPVVVYAGTDSSYLYRTTTGGASWSHLTSADGFLPQDAYIRSITVAAGGRLYVGADSGRVYLSTDAGTSWSVLSTMPATHSVRNILIHPNNPAILFAATFGDGVFVSVDSGQHWSAMNPGLADLEVYALESDHASPLNLYAGSGANGVFHTAYSFVDHAPVLAAIGNKATLANQILAFTVSATDSDATLPVLTAAGLPSGAAFVDSLDGHGAFAWTPAAAQVGTHLVTFRASDGLLSDSEVVHITVLDSATSSVVSFPVAGGWEMVSLPVVVADSSRTTLFPTSSSAAFSYEGGYAAKESLRTGSGYWVKFPAGQTVEVSGGNLVRDTVDMRANWNMIGSISVPVATADQVHPVTPLTVLSNYFGYSGGYALADTLMPGRAYWVKVDQGGKLVLAASTGQTPGMSQAGPRGTARPSAAAETLSVLSVLDAGGGHGTLYFSASPLLSEVFELPPPPPAGLFDLRFASGSMAATGEQLADARVLVASARYPLSISWKIKRPSDEAALVIEGAPTEMRGSGSVTIARRVSEIRVIRVSGSSAGPPAGYALARSYPNPFNPSTTIGFGMPVAGFVSLNVYNMLGEEIADLVNEQRERGWHLAVWNAGNVPSGVYFYVLRVFDPASGVLRYSSSGKTTLLR
jgi:photosystem II stability/assembly factor-like uncharacterized protein